MSVFDAMRRYVDSADRTSPLVFVGRRREAVDLAESAARYGTGVR